MSGETFIIEGLADLEKAMMEMAKSVTVKIAERALTNSAEPLVDHAQELAPKDKGHLESHIAASKRLSRRQARLNVKKSDVEIYVGPDNAPQGVQQEFGNRYDLAQPFMRPAWDATKYDVLLNVKSDLGTEIDAAAKRAARRQAKLIAQVKAGRL